MAEEGASIRDRDNASTAVAADSQPLTVTGGWLSMVVGARVCKVGAGKQ
jgi:hypothetical protein